MPSPDCAHLCLFQGSRMDEQRCSFPPPLKVSVSGSFLEMGSLRNAAVVWELCHPSRQGQKWCSFPWAERVPPPPPGELGVGQCCQDFQESRLLLPPTVARCLPARPVGMCLLGISGPAGVGLWPFSKPSLGLRCPAGPGAVAPAHWGPWEALLAELWVCSVGLSAAMLWLCLRLITAHLSLAGPPLPESRECGPAQLFCWAKRLLSALNPRGWPLFSGRAAQLSSGHG